MSNQASHYQDHPRDTGLSQKQYIPLYDFLGLENEREFECWLVRLEKGYEDHST